jgi:hypothetical protein
MFAPSEYSFRPSVQNARLWGAIARIKQSIEGYASRASLPVFWRVRKEC